MFLEILFDSPFDSPFAQSCINPTSFYHYSLKFNVIIHPYKRVASDDDDAIRML